MLPVVAMGRGTERRPKSDQTFAALGATDELNSHVGLGAFYQEHHFKYDVFSNRSASASTQFE
jgi:cob(I)alamin adenosyltransferase